jgi:hypothetical protein
MPSEKLKKAEHRQGTKICKWWRDGSVSIEWIDQQSGEKVVGDFIQVGPTQSSAEFAARTDRMLRGSVVLLAASPLIARPNSTSGFGSAASLSR